MSKQERISTDRAPKPVGLYPHARKVGNLLFLSGVGPRVAGSDNTDSAVPGLKLDHNGNFIEFDFEAQCRSVFDNVRIILEESGSSWDQLVDVTVFLVNMKRDFHVYNRVYAEYFKDNLPCRTTVEINSLPTPIAIELKCIATIDEETMISFIIRCTLAALSLFSTVALFYNGYWGWGILMIFLTAIVGFSFFRNENMILALNQMRLGNTEKAKRYVNKITHPQFLMRRQHAYVIFLQAVLNTQDIGFTKSEQMLRKAISLGLRTGQDNAVARMHLAGICVQTGRRQEAVALLAEAKKLDSSGMMKDQINQMQAQLKVAPSKNQMRMAQMSGGRKKTPRR